MDQLKLTLTIFEILHPECVAVFSFDISSKHHKYAPDALRANGLKKSDGRRSVSLIRPGWFTTDGNRVVQPVKIEINGQAKQKGAMRILQERGL